jgi:hypothetical protein
MNTIRPDRPRGGPQPHMTVEVTATLMMQDYSDGVRVYLPLFRSVGEDSPDISLALDRIGDGHCTFALSALQNHDQHTPPFFEGDFPEEQKRVDKLRPYIKRILSSAKEQLVGPDAGAAKFGAAAADGFDLSKVALVDTFDEAWPEGDPIPALVSLIVS